MTTEQSDQLQAIYDKVAKKIRVVQLVTLAASVQTLDLTGYEGYENFVVGENLFIVFSNSTLTGPAWSFYRPYSASLTLSLTYNASTGKLTVPANIVTHSISGSTSGETNTSTYSLKVSGYVYLVF